jgi:gliding motility-associated protein GldC
MAEKHQSEIVLKIFLDENKIPEKLEWTAQDGDIDGQESKAFLLSIWDNVNKETLKMDLWTKDMPIDDMKFFFYQTLLSMADTFQRATNDEKMTATMRDFADYFAEKMEIIEKK